MKRKFLLLVSGFVLFSFVLILVHSCRKSDGGSTDQPVTANTTDFFNKHPATDPNIIAVQSFVKHQESQYHFIDKLTSNIGLPYWDKAIVNRITNTSAVNQNAVFAYIPFVRDSQNYVSTSLVVRMTVSDTTFRLLFDWQYANFAFDNTQDSIWSARDVFSLFTMHDLSVFGIDKFKITDGRIFGRAQTDTFMVQIKRDNAAAQGARNEDVIVQTCYIVQARVARTDIVPGPPDIVCTFKFLSGGGGAGIPGGSAGGGTGTGAGGGTPAGGGWNPTPCKPALQDRVDGTATGSCGAPGWQPLPPPQDPCAVAKPFADKATAFSKDPAYGNAKANIQQAAADGKEHGISFGKNASGAIIRSAITTGDDHSATLGTINKVFADMHNHPVNLPPSSGDLYGFITKAAANENTYGTKYIITLNGTVYAFAMINLQYAQAFNTNFPKIENPGFEPGFPTTLSDQYYDIIEREKGLYGKPPQDANEIAIAYMLSTYNTGVALLKQGNDGSFKRINVTINPDSSGNPYLLVNCQ